ncbi:MAG: transglutaminase domain-containing protein [Bacteroidota bacterium]|nr:transglutaminase [Odoribacter sp.]MDP3641591.1 transglutaminase domain-containing protein [Bacteroidota bacterium]
MVNRFFALTLISILLLSCSKKQSFIQNPERLADIQHMLLVQKELTSKSLLPIWDIFNQPLSPEEKQALEFVYAYMPLSDLADYEPEFFLKNIQFSLKVRQEMAWGKSIPEEEFLHFVLPLRVNNENLDNFREVMYDEITTRIKGMDMKQAALEINHWCHEKVNYRGTDSRTSSPLSAVKKTFGRCGEESTFTVSAMRTAGIPARQVYTPRWAHSDDNHAWVEVWIDGKWNYLGACEPDVDLNMGWFSEPATRVMLVHTRAYGKYFGTGQVLTPEDRFSELNLTSNYAATKKITISVKKADGTPADSAKVEFQLYNYAEYYPIATGFTNAEGFASLNTGMGDLVIWAAKDGKFAYQKLSVPEKDTLQLVLNQSTPVNVGEVFDLVPPHNVKVESTVTPEAKKTNDIRLAKEDSIRNATMATFKDSVWITDFAAKTKLPADTIARFIKLSYGNWDQISAYLEKNAATFRSTVLELAIQLADKDYSDAPESILTDHLVQTAQSGVKKLVPSKELFTKYILSPRIALENLSPWRSFLAAKFSSEMVQSTRTDISVLTNWIRENIRINTVANKHSRAPLSPTGVYNLRVADPLSRDIFFVAACRTFGIPARLNPETQIPEYNKNGEWLRAGFDAEILTQPEKGMLKLNDKGNPVAPQYYLHYTIGFLKDGFYRTLEFPEGGKLTNTVKPLELEMGQYSLITGNRLEDGSVLSKMTFFTIEKGKLTTIPVELRKQSGELKPSGKLNFDALNLQKTSDGKVVGLSSLVAGKFSVLVMLDPDKEPSNHILNDLGPYIDHFNKWGGQFIFAMPTEKAGQAGVLKTYQLPAKMESGIDPDDQILNAISAIYGSGLKDKLPLVLFCDAAGNVYLFSSGYKIGMGEQLLKVISAIESNPKMVEAKVSCSKP